MSTNFVWALQVVLHHEGGFVDDRDDPGGATDFGISLRFLQTVLEDADEDGFADGDIDRDGDIDIDDIRKLDFDDVATLYENKFWKKAKCDKIKSQLLAVKAFDMSVNMGPKQAWKLIQRACNTLGATLVVDGKAGKKTLASVNSLLDLDFMLVVNLRREQDRFYNGLIRKKPSLAKFELGWRRRAAF